MFSKGDKVISIWEPDRVGIVRVRYRHTYLISFPDKKRGFGIECHIESNLISADSPLAEKIKDIDKKATELDEQIQQLDKEKRELLERSKEEYIPIQHFTLK